jgi:hypothetical protein
VTDRLIVTAKSFRTRKEFSFLSGDALKVGCNFSLNVKNYRLSYTISSNFIEEDSLR